MSIDIEQIRKREQAATPGPWVKDSDSPWRIFRSDGQASLGGPMVAGVAEDDFGSFEEGDAEFIAHAREDVPALLDEVERLRSALDSSAVGHGIAVAHAGDWKHRAEMAEAERDRLRAAVDAVRGVAAHCDFDCGCTECLMARAVLAALDEHLGEG